MSLIKRTCPLQEDQERPWQDRGIVCESLQQSTDLIFKARESLQMSFTIGLSRP
jgi:hypothetical protein